MFVLNQRLHYLEKMQISFSDLRKKIREAYVNSSEELKSSR